MMVLLLRRLCTSMGKGLFPWCPLGLEIEAFQKGMYVLVGNRTVPSREVPGRSWDGTGQDLETLKVSWSCGPGIKEVQKSQDLFLKVLGLPGPFSLTGFC